jgi:hypothetical protein
MMTALALITGAAAGADDFFTSKVEPLLRKRCFECHSHEHKIKGGLALDSKAGWEQGGESGPAVEPGRPGASLLIQAVSHVEKDLKMPPKAMLPAAEIALLEEWVKKGAPDPRAAAPSATLAAEDAWEVEFQKRLDWWSLKPMSQAGGGGVDEFIRAAQRNAGLDMAPQAPEEVLRRRLSFVLTGLPPSDSSHMSGLSGYVEALLNSPHYGEHFARRWMDVVRYTDTYGYEWDNPAKGSHEYRDYLVRAFNDDIGFDQLLREHLAGDLLAKPRIHPAAQTQESLIGPMFYHMGEHRHGSSLMFNGIHQEMVNNKIDAFSKAFLATTVACARCHDHKLEAVSQRDYYALAAMFTTPRWTSRVIDAPGRNDKAIATLKELREDIRTELAELWRPAFTAERLRPWADSHPRALTGVGAPLATPVDLANLAVAWRKSREAAQRANLGFSRASLEKWVFEGDGFKHGLTKDGTPLIALTGEKVLAGLLQEGWHSHALSSKLPGSLRMPPQHRVQGRFVSLKLAGGEFAGHLVVDDHAFQNETVAFYTNPEPQWKSFADAALKNGVQQVTVEFCTSSLNPNFPPRTGLAKGLPNHDFGHDKRSWISITGIVTHDTAGMPQDELDAFTSLYEDNGVIEPWDRIAAWFNAAASRWREGRPHPGDREVLDWLLANDLLPNKAAPGTRLARLVSDYRRIESGIAFPRTVNSMDERDVTPVSYPLNVRGNVDTTGEPVAPASLKMLHGEGVQNRLDLAESLLHPEHPLTARVYVNRVWQWIFGTGIVATPDDFGRLGDKPSHPELLDWLAREFIREGWSTKKLVRKLVLSETFRQDSLRSPGPSAAQTAHSSASRPSMASEIDPYNRLLSFYPTRRLEAEAIRDSLLAVSGHLDPRLYGRPILPYRTAEDDKKRLFTGPLDGNGRRSIYLQMSIMDPPKFLTGFNLPDLKLPTGRRDVTNVPTQALILLNDPFVREMAGHWAGQMVAQKSTKPAERIRRMFLRAFSREPTDAESRRWQAALQSFGGDTAAAWESLAHAFFNTKEFIYHR